MAGKITPVPFSAGGKDLGVHHSRSFNTDDETDLRDYSDLRTRNNDPTSGVRIERVREIVKTEVTVHSEDGAREEHRVDRLYLFIEWWESKPRVVRGEADEVPKTFSVEWSPVVAEEPPKADDKN